MLGKSFKIVYGIFLNKYAVCYRGCHCGVTLRDVISPTSWIMDAIIFMG